MKPDFTYEKPLWVERFTVIGVDEVGRGAVAGPVVAGAVGLKIQNSHVNSSEFTVQAKLQVPNIESLGIDDSKRLTKKQREKLEPIIKKYFYWGIGEVDAGTINRVGIQRATRLAMRRAIKKMFTQITNSKFQIPNKSSNTQISEIKILIDGRRVKGIGRQKAIIKGDQKSISIAAASIIAKVYRDRLMNKLGKKYIHYGFSRHVGYGTKLHRMMIEKYGMCKIHRKKFVESLLRNKTINNELSRK